MRTGVSKLDAQHRMLIQKFNEFSVVIDSRGDTRQAAEKALDYLQFYATWHFKQEEDCMEKYNCPVAAGNKQTHKEFLAQFGDLYECWKNDTLDHDLAQETHEKLAAWIVNHIINIDTRLKPCVPEP